MERSGSWQRRRGGGRSSPAARGWSPRPQSPVVTAHEVSGVGSMKNDGIKTPHQNSTSGSHYEKNNNNSPQPDACSTASSSNCEMLLSHLSNKLTISETSTEAETPLSSRSAHDDSPTTEAAPFDICPPKSTAAVVLKPPLLLKNRERRNQIRQISNTPNTPNGILLRPGMLLLKAFLSLTDQVNIVKKCRELGLGSGGFCQPGYREGTKMHLKMMCLGKSWDPQTSQYTDRRLSDGAKPPDLPPEFNHLIEKAIEDSHALIRQQSKTTNPHKNLPSMSPSICIVNFYTQNGRLGLHQDKDESEESLRQQLPVVSFSIGDSADFLYGDERDVDKAQKVVLESGDVLIFGGKSRNVFHGVTAIHPTTAPKLLLEETNLRPGRLNLTFRQY